MASQNLIRWLANGRRGTSSNTIVTHLTGIDAMGKWDRRSHPYDPDDMTRCRRVLEEVPELQALFKNMATCSPQWAVLIEHWQELCDLMDSEAPDWRAGLGDCPNTYRRMYALLNPAHITTGGRKG